MVWFKVDDGFYDHPKIEDLSMAARGLWVTAGSWCGKQLTDGVISKKRVRQLGGTPAQIKGLIEAGLWIETKDDSGSIAYAFRDWFDMQPSREQVKESREIERERKRNWRSNRTAQTSDKQDKRENVPTGQPTGQPPGQDAGQIRPSRHPDPTRPDPTLYIDQGSQPTTGDHVREETMAGELNLDDLAAATRRARQAGISEQAITRGTAEYHKRPEPKGPGLLRTLIDDAHAELASEETQSAQRASRRAAIEACDQCDENGMRYTNGQARRCNHQTPPF